MAADRRGYRGGALILIAAFMIVSAVVRLAAEAAPALARAAGPDEPDRPEAAAQGPANSAVQGAALLGALQDREARLAQRERALAERIQALKIAEKAVEDRIAALETAEERLRRTLALADGASERDLANLTSVYEQMKPKETAAVFEEMAPEFAAGFLARMRPEIAAAVMEGMDPRAAYTISVVLAGRNVGVPTE